MKTVKNMWALSKPMTVVTLIVVVGLIGALGFLWWMPVNFGYPWYTILGNFYATAVFGAAVMMIRELVNE